MMPAAPAPVPASKTAKSRPGAKNPRRGQVKKTAPDQPAQFEEGAAAPPKTFDAEDIATKMNMWWEVGAGEEYVIEVEPGYWAEWREKKIIKKMRQRFFIRTVAGDGEPISDSDRVLLHTMEKRSVAKVLPSLSGYRAGIHDFGGRNFLVKSSPKIPKPEKGEWATISALLERLDLEKCEGGIDQLPWFHSLMKIALDSLLNSEPGNFRQGHFLILAGPNGCGKGRIQNQIITGLLGGRSADPTKYMLGQDEFNADLFEAEHLMMEELPTSSQKTVDRNQFSENIKRVVANSNARLRMMRQEPLTCNPFWRGSLSINEAADVIRQIPLLRPGYSDKVLMMRVANSPMPMPLTTPAQQRAFRDKIAGEMAAYAWWLLNEWKIPEALLWYGEPGKSKEATRFGFREFHHPDLVHALFDDTPEAELVMLLDKAEFWMGEQRHKLWDLPYPVNQARTYNRAKKAYEPTPGLWRGGYLDLQEILEGERDWNSSVATAAKRLFRHNSADRLLSRLKPELPDRIDNARDGTSGRYWLISRPPAE